MPTTALRRTVAWVAAITLLGVPAAPLTADDTGDNERTVIWCENEDQEDCRGVVVDVDSSPNVFYLGENGEDLRFNVTAPRFAYSFGGGAYLGVNLVNLTPELREHFGAPAGSGVMVSRVEGDTPAFRAGLRVGDVITAVDDDGVESASGVSGLIRKHEEGDEVPIEVIRDGSPLTLRPVLAERPRPAFDVGSWVHFSGDGDEDGPRTMVLDIEPEALRESLEHFRTAWNDEAVQKRLNRFQFLESSLEDKIDALEQRIQELERELEGRN